MKVYELIEQMISDGTWVKWCSVSDDAMTKNKQYSVYSLIRQLEPDKKYGYRVRIANYISTNGVRFAGGGYFAN